MATKDSGAALNDVLGVVQFYSEGPRARDQIFVPANGLSPVHSSYDPISFVVPHDRVNLEDRRLRVPYRVLYLPTLYCTQRCAYCYAKLPETPEKELISVARMRDVIHELAQLGVEVLSLSGGEVFARHDIFDLLQEITTAGLVPYIPTKYPLSSQMASRLRDVGVDLIQFSIDSMDPGVLEWAVGVKGYHGRAVSALENLKAAQIKVRTNSVLTRNSIQHVPAMLRFLGELGNVVHVALSPYSRSQFVHDDALFVSQDALDALQPAIKDVGAAFPQMRVALGGSGRIDDEVDRTVSWRKRAYCTGNRDGFVILPDGRVTVCEELYDHPAFIIGDLRTQSVMEIWNSEAALRLIHPDQDQVPDGACKSCRDFVHCHAGRGRCWRDAVKAYGPARHYWPDPRCPHAPSGFQLYS